MMNYTLIDNSTERLSMIYTLTERSASQSTNTVKIAIGYWNIQGHAMLADVFKSSILTIDSYL